MKYSMQDILEHHPVRMAAFIIVSASWIVLMLYILINGVNQNKFNWNERNMLAEKNVDIQKVKTDGCILSLKSIMDGGNWKDAECAKIYSKLNLGNKD